MNKQETLEEAAERIFDGFGDITKPVVIKRAIELVKGQQERMYSEEDLREAFRQGEQNISYSETYGLDSKLTEQEWFEQFKKK